MMRSGKHGAAAHDVRLMQYVTAETTRTSPERIAETQWKGIKNMAHGKGNGVENGEWHYSRRFSVCQHAANI